MHTDLHQSLTGTYGPLMDSHSICRVLYYPSVSALQAAKSRGKLPFDTVELEGRRGLFAFTEDVAAYLTQLSGRRQRYHASNSACAVASEN